MMRILFLAVSGLLMVAGSSNTAVAADEVPVTVRVIGKFVPTGKKEKFHGRMRPVNQEVKFSLRDGSKFDPGTYSTLSKPASLDPLIRDEPCLGRIRDAMKGLSIPEHYAKQCSTGKGRYHLKITTRPAVKYEVSMMSALVSPLPTPKIVPGIRIVEATVDFECALGDGGPFETLFSAPIGSAGSDDRNDHFRGFTLCRNPTIDPTFLKIAVEKGYSDHQLELMKAASADVSLQRGKTLPTQPDGGSPAGRSTKTGDDAI